MKHGTQAHIARVAQISPQLLNHYLSGRKNAASLIADRLAALTGTDIRVWLKGGNLTKRHEAVAKWKGHGKD